MLSQLPAFPRFSFPSLYIRKPSRSVAIFSACPSFSTSTFPNRVHRREQMCVFPHKVIKISHPINLPIRRYQHPFLRMDVAFSLPGKRTILRGRCSHSLRFLGIWPAASRSLCPLVPARHLWCQSTLAQINPFCGYRRHSAPDLGCNNLIGQRPIDTIPIKPVPPRHLPYTNKRARHRATQTVAPASFGQAARQTPQQHHQAGLAQSRHNG